MICPSCHGKGDRRAMVETAEGPRPCPYLSEPCPECGGTGISHCCDGHQPSERDKEIERSCPDLQPKEER